MVSFPPHPPSNAITYSEVSQQQSRKQLCDHMWEGDRGCSEKKKIQNKYYFQRYANGNNSNMDNRYLFVQDINCISGVLGLRSCQTCPGPKGMRSGWQLLSIDSGNTPYIAK